MAATVRSVATAIANVTQVASLTITKPSGAAQGDVFVASLLTAGTLSGACAISPPAGWTTLDSRFTTLSVPAAIACFWKRAGSSEPANYTFTLTNSEDAQWSGVMAALANAADPEAFVALQTTPGFTTLTHTPDITGLGTDRLDCRFGISPQGNSWLHFPGGYGSTAEAVSNAGNVGFAAKAQSAAGAYGVQDFESALAFTADHLGYSVVFPPGGQVARGPRQIAYY